MSAAAWPRRPMGSPASRSGSVHSAYRYRGAESSHVGASTTATYTKLYAARSNGSACARVASSRYIPSMHKSWKLQVNSQSSSPMVVRK